MTPRRTLLLAVGALSAPAIAQPGWPTRPIRLVVPWAPGGATSNIARLVGDAVSPLLGQPVVLDHRPGAGGAIGSENVARSAPDGYSALIAGAGTFYRPLIERDVPFVPERDFLPVAPIGDGPFALVVRRGLPDSLPGFLEAARGSGGRLNFASSGQGSTSHLAAEAFNRAAGFAATHVPYRGAAPAMTDLVGGRVDYLFDAFSSVLENVRAGQIRLLGVSTPVRAPQAPEVPTVAEAGLPGFSIAPWWGIVGPAGMPGEAVTRLSLALGRALANQWLVDALAGQGCRAFHLEPAAFAAYVRAENAAWSRVIEAAGLRVS